jgi:hypothetical protein
LAAKLIESREEKRLLEEDEKELAEEKIAAELHEVCEANRLLAEELFKRNEEAKARAEKEVADALRFNTPVADDMNNTIQQPLLEKIVSYYLEEAQVCLNDEISVATSFHNVGQVQFSLMIHFKKMDICYRVGDFHPDRKGYFACCGYLENDIANLTLFFIDKDFKEPFRLTYKYYMKFKFVPNQQLNHKVTIML